MKRNPKTAGLTLIELLVIIAVIAVFAAMVPCAPRKAKAKAKQIACGNNLKCVGFAFRIWAGDNEDKYPMELSLTNGGAMEAIASGDLVTVFEVMSNDLNTPKILYCPAADSTRHQASAFGRTPRSVNNYASIPFSGNSNVTYFVGMDANTNLPSAFLSGDDNFLVGTNSTKSGILSLNTNSPLAWSKTRHDKVGNIGLADGSVQGFSSSALFNALANTGVETNRLALP
jgi:prepilin-type processing-associated H-X9-DG protein